MEYVFVTMLGLIAGWLVNLVADTVPERLPFFTYWYRPLFQLPRSVVRLCIEPVLSSVREQRGETVDDMLDQAPTLRYSVVWVSAIGLGWLTYAHSGMSLTGVVMALYAWFFLAIAAIDLEHRKVYNRMLLVALPVMVLFTPFIEGPSILSALAGGIFGFVLFLILAMVWPGAMGMGDVKLAGVIGLVTGFPGILVAILICIFSGGFMAALLLIRTRFQRGQTMAYAPYLVLGAWASLYYGNELWIVYMSI